MNRRKILGYALGPIGSGILGLISLPIITWFYSVEDVGRISMLQVFTSLTMIFFCLGMDQAYVREYHETENKAALLKTVLFPGFFLSIIFFVIILIYEPTLISMWLYEKPSEYLSILTVVCFIIALISKFLSLILRMQERSIAFSMSQILPKIIFLIIIINSVWLNLSRDTYNLITANFVATLVAFLVFSWNTRSDWILAINQKLDKNQLKKSMKFGWPLVFSGIAYWGLNTMDKVFLRNYSTYEELGIYAVTMSVAAIVTIFSGIFNTIWSPMVYKWISEDNFDYCKLDKMLEYVTATIYFFIVLVGLFSWIIPYFLPENFHEIQYLIAVCLLGPLLYTLSEITGIGITITRKTKFSILCTVLAMFVSVILNYIFVPRLGAAGAAISTAISFFVFFYLRTEVSKKIWRGKEYSKNFIIISVLLVTGVLNLVLKEYRAELYILWIILFLVGLFLFRGVLKELIILIKTRVC